MEQKKYNVIYADPPWHYQVYSRKGERGGRGLCLVFMGNISLSAGGFIRD